MIRQTQPGGMSRAVAKRAELSIIGLCVVAIAMIFQPFSNVAFSVGCVLVVIGGLAFNLVPLCTAGKPFTSLLKGGGVVLAVFAAVVLLALGSAYLYSLYLQG